MSYEAFFAGVGGIVLGALLGSWLTAKFTFDFQKRLLDQQLAAEEKAHRELLVWLEKKFLIGIMNRWNTTFHKEIYPMITPTLDKIDRALDKAEEARSKKQDGA